MGDTINFDYYYGIEAEQFSFYRVPRLLIKDERFKGLSSDAMEAQTKLETVEHQLETAKVEVTKPFAQEAELAEKLERLSALNALLNMDEKGNDGIDMDDEGREQPMEKSGETQISKESIVADGSKRQFKLHEFTKRPSLKERLSEMRTRVRETSVRMDASNRGKKKEESL